MFSWNVGGAALSDVPRALKEVVGSDCDDDIVCLQEVARGPEGWQQQNVDGWYVVSHRKPENWRATGLMLRATKWTVMRRKGSDKGCWLRLRHVLTGSQLWVGASHFTPGCSQVQFAREVAQHLSVLPSTSLPVIQGSDLNAKVSWGVDEGLLHAVAREGKFLEYTNQCAARRLHVCPPEEDQLQTPTSRPRQEGRIGHQIDAITVTDKFKGRVHIHTGSYMVLGTDHELLSLSTKITGGSRQVRFRSEPRVWKGGLALIDRMDQDYLVQLAKQYTQPRPSLGYRDPVDVKQAFKQARLLKTRQAWTTARNLRKAARKVWEAARIKRATEGDFQELRKLKPTSNHGWDSVFSESQGEDNPHEVVHRHLQGIYSCATKPTPVDAWPREVQAFTMPELEEAVAKGKKNKATGTDGTSHELIVGICETPGGRTHLLEMFNKIFVSGRIPEDWNRVLMVVLPKVLLPTEVTSLRPIAMGSAAAKIYSRMLLARTLPLLTHLGPQQCAGVGRQTSEYIYCVAKLMDLCKEWKVQAAFAKIDVAKAYDTVDRRVLLAKLKDKLGDGPLYRAWHQLLMNTSAYLQTPWGSSWLSLDRGIKQGAVESPSIFSWLTQLCLHEASERYGWSHYPNPFEGLNLSEIQFMDDGILWSVSGDDIQSKLRQWSVVLNEYGLRLNPKKCQLYYSPYAPNHKSINVNGVDLQPSTTMVVMGLPFKVGVTASELLGPILARARDKFWSLKHLFRANTPLFGRVKLLERVVGGTALWCIAAILPDRASLGLINSFQLQLVAWCMKSAKGGSESWPEFKARTFRGARQVIANYLKQRWSSLWLSRWWGFAGHRARGCLHTHPNASTIVDSYRNREWWLSQQRLKNGIRHKGFRGEKGVFYAKLMNFERDMDAVAKGPWRVAAQNRTEWKQLCLQWVKVMDVPWTSGRQTSLEW